VTVPIQKFRTLEEMEIAWVSPGTAEHNRSIQAVFGLVSLFVPKRKLPPGVFRYRTIEEADAQRECWERQCARGRS
jgi:hypothetical protein